ncbi:filamentous hemagglutinin N-terminal domain-containing protein [Moorena sp. SIO4G3]|uniref:two-partner secretion domain-containing protein n=1 Tax=Moorena sp. SIO4G3 TaxID=2607821 RepID=UPI00142B66AE|nr:filamentous hemagglutinin N-terminal domain-containing protein [Moorena sp. SIO4G3]NEO80793.1 S-layer family protein [Moorena sp. SIO4G3]
MQASPFVLYSLLAATTALGQITPDNTLGNESSVVTPNVNVNGTLADLIEGGAIRESNLFHSFSDFNVAEMGRVYFGLPAGVANILSRVTGTNVSNILGTLGVLGNANLFLINPKGIFFGPNSRLDIRGSFFGSTADSVLFDDGTVFSALNPNAKPLLTINIPSGLQYGSNPGSITNQSSLFVVPNGQTLGLIGGEVTIPGGALLALDGRIELGGVAPNSLVNLTPTDTSFVLDYSSVQEFQDISLSEGALVDTSGESGGSIQVQGANVSLRDRSFVFADTEGSGSGGGIVVKASQLSLEGGSRITADVLGSGQGGDLTVNATESVRVSGVSPNGIVSFLAARVFRGATGNAEDVSINTGELIVSDGAKVSADTRGLGDGGTLSVNGSSTIELMGTTPDSEFSSGLFSGASTGSTGNAGDLSITTGELIVSDGGFVSAGTRGIGDGGTLSVNASETVKVIGTTPDGEFPSGLFSGANQGSTGNAGDLSINTGELIVSDGSFVSANTFSKGDGGNLTVNASSTIELMGTTPDGESPSGLFSEASTGSTGNAGDLSINTGELILSDGASVSTTTFREGDGGTLSVYGSSRIELIGRTADTRFPTGLFAGTLATGNGGDVIITTGELIVSDGAQVSAGTVGLGDGGKLTVNASSTIQLMGTADETRFLTGLFALTLARGNGGDVSINTGELIVSDGAQVSAGTVGLGDGGNLTVNASSKIQLIGSSADALFPIIGTPIIGTSVDDRIPSGLLTEAQGTGNAGEFLKITTGQLIISDGAEVSATSTQPGSSAGTVDINANSIFLDNKGIITAETAGKEGNIILEARDIRLLDESNINTNAQNTDGGNIEINTDTLVGLGNSDITANAQLGPGGSVTINAQGIFGLEFRDRPTPDNDITATSELGPSFSGEVILNTPDVDPTSGLTELPGSLVDAEAILANDLCGFENNRIAGGSSFTITGKGGLPASAEDAVINTDRTVGWLSRPGLPSSSRQALSQPPLAFGHESRKAFGHESRKAFGHATRTVTQPQPPQEKKVIIEAQGWVTAKDGTIILTAQPFRGTPVEQILPNLDCHSGGGSRE